MIYVLHESIDLGSHVIGLFSTKEKAESAKVQYFEWYKNRSGLEADLFIEENKLDQLGLGYGDNKEVFNF